MKLNNLRTKIDTGNRRYTQTQNAGKYCSPTQVISRSCFVEAYCMRMLMKLRFGMIHEQFLMIYKPCLSSQIKNIRQS